MSPEVKSLIFAIIATICIVAGVFLILSAINAKRHADMIHYHLGDDNSVVIAKIIGILALLLGIFNWYLAGKARPMIIFPNNDSYFTSEKKDTLIFDGKTYIIDKSENYD